MTYINTTPSAYVLGYGLAPLRGLGNTFATRSAIFLRRFRSYFSWMLFLGS